MLFFISFYAAIFALIGIVTIARLEYDSTTKPIISEPIEVEPYYSYIDSFVHDMNFDADRDMVPREPFSWIENNAS